LCLLNSELIILLIFYAVKDGVWNSKKKAYFYAILYTYFYAK